MLPDCIKKELRDNTRALKVSYASERDAECVRGAIHNWVIRRFCRLNDPCHYMIGVVVGYYIDRDCDFAIVKPIDETLSDINPEYVIPDIGFDSKMQPALLGFITPNKFQITERR